MAGAGGCRWSEEIRDDRRELHIVRADDLLSLRFRLRNLRVEHRRHQHPWLVRERPGEEAVVVVELPGQHVAEEAFPEDRALVAAPVASRLAGPTRLAFRLPLGAPAVPLTLESLLDWRGWVAVLPTTAEAPPGEEETAIEMPSRVVLAPDATSQWSHAIRPVTHRGRTELWHTRLLAEGGDEEGPEVAVVWSPDLAEPRDDLTTSLSATDRRDLVGRTARARTLILSPAGGWLDVQGAWEVEAPPSRVHASSLEKWHHVSTAGQDQRVLVQRAGGFLLPFGHPAALVKVTERKLQGGARPLAVLRQRYFVVVKRPRVTYRPGASAFRAMTAVDRVTPSLVFEKGPRPEDRNHFWIETGDGAFPFRFQAEDWVGRSLVLDAPAVFLSHGGKVDPARRDYDAGSEERRVRPMRSQEAAVVPFLPVVGSLEPGASDTDRWGEPLEGPRSAGDTTLRLLQVGFSADEASSKDAVPPFVPRTDTVQASVPALDPHLDQGRNRGWFELVDPDTEDNLGEVFARADRRRDAPPIPLHFDQHADRSGGVASPAFAVAGLSRVRGPVGDTRPLFRDQAFDPESYFDPDSARLLGGLPLAALLAPPPPTGKGSPAIPRISFRVGRVWPDEKDGKTPPPFWETSLGLSWNVPLQSGPGRFVSFVAESEETALRLSARLTKRLGDPPSAPKEGDQEGEGGNQKKKPSPVDWKVSGQVNDFALQIHAGTLGTLAIRFAHLGLELATPKTKKEDGEEKKEGGVQLDFRLAGVAGEGPLVLLDLLLSLLSHRPPFPELPEGEEAPSYPASLPDVGSTDLGVTLGPFRAPKSKWGSFEVTNAAVSVGVGLFFSARPMLFTLRLASPDAPLTLMAKPWGGLAHVGFNFSSEGLVGFQAGVGVVYKIETTIAGTKAKVEGSLSCVFTFVAEGDPQDRFDVVLRLVGEATILGFVELRLALRVAATWQDGRWLVDAEVRVRIKIAFFAVQVTYRLTYFLSDAPAPNQVAAAAPGRGLTESQWHIWAAAFAGELA